MTFVCFRAALPSITAVQQLQDFIDVFSMHVYDEQFEKLFSVANLTDRVAADGVPIWVTETGTENFNDQLDYFRTVPDVYGEFGIRPDRWTIYAWNDDTLGFSVRNPEGANSPLLQALIDRRDGV